MFGVEVVWTDENGQRSDIEDYILEMMEENGMLGAAGIVVDCPYAEAIEFGTRPFKAGKAFRKNIEKWVTQKYGLLELSHSYDYRGPMTAKQRKSEIKRIAFNIAENISEHGMRPHPFFRSAWYKFMSGGLESYVDQNTSVTDVVNMIADEMKRILRERDAVYTGTLINSIRVVKLGDPEAGVGAEVPPPDVWGRVTNHKGLGPNEIWEDALPPEWESIQWGDE